MGDKARARAYADSALAVSQAQAAAAPTDPQAQALYGVMLAYLGRAAEARKAGDEAVQLARGSTPLNRLYALLQHVRINLALGDNNGALDDLERYLAAQTTITPAWLRIDPTFAQLRGNPRFERLTRGS